MEWRVQDYEFTPSQLAAERRAARPGGGHVRCQVEGCPNDLASLRPFYQRLRICEAHAKASYVTDASGNALRFCQQCSKLQPLSAFQGERRSCAISLDKRRARRTVTAAQELKLLELPGIPGGGTDGTGLGRRKRQGRTRPYDSGSGSGSPGGSDEQTTALPRQLNSKLRRLGRPGGRSPGDSGGSGAHSAAAGPSHQPARGLDAPASAAGMLYGWHGGAGGVPGLQPSPWMAPALFGGGAGVPPLPLAAQHSSATSPAMLLELQHLDTVHGMHMRGPDAPGGHGALPGSAAAAAADGALMAASDLDLLLALGPEDLADCLLDFHDGGGPAAAAMADTALDMLPGPFLDGLPLAAGGASGASQGQAQTAGHAVPTAPLASPQQPGASAGSAEHAPSTEVEGSTGHVFLGPPTSGARVVLNAAGGSTGHPSTASAPQQPAASSPSAAAGAAASAGSAGAAELPAHEGSSDADALATFSFKLFDCTPDTLPKDLRAQLQTALALAPTVMHASMRTGCVCLTTTVLLNRAELVRLEGGTGGLPGAVVAAVGRVHPGKVLCHAGSRLSVADGTAGTVSHLRLPADATSSCAELAAPRLVTPAVLVGGGSGSLQLVLTGPGIASAEATLHCRSRGRHQVVTVLRARRAWLEALPPGRRAPSVDEPDTPPAADARPADPHDSADEGERPSTWAATPGPDREDGTPTAAALAFERLELGSGDDALLVELAAPEGGWGLLELEVATGPVLSAATPLLVLPRWARAAAQELAALPSVGAPGGFEPAAFLQHLGFALHTAEAARQPGATPLHPSAAERVSRLSRRIALACDSRGWLATARLLLPAMAICSAPASADTSRSPGKQARAGARPLADAPVLAAVLRSSKGASPEEQEQLEAMLSRLVLAEERCAAAVAEAPPPPPPGLRAQLAAQAHDWFWAGCNLAAGMASVALLVRNLGGL